MPFNKPTPLCGKTALVLGAVRGIGRAVALDLAALGADLVLTRHDWKADFDEMEAAFAKAKGRVRIRDIDLRDTDAVTAMMAEIEEESGRLDILVNNIERGGMPVVHGAYTEPQWNLEQETTLRAKQWVVDAAMPLLKASGDGVIVTLSSIAGIVGRSGPASLFFNEGYAAANRGISLLTETWARLGAPEVRVNELMLGFFETRHGPRTRGWGLISEREQRALVDHTLLKRTGTLVDVVKAVRFLVMDAPYMTGTVMRLDGGYPLAGDPVWPMPEGVE